VTLGATGKIPSYDKKEILWRKSTKNNDSVIIVGSEKAK